MVTVEEERPYRFSGVFGSVKSDAKSEEELAAAEFEMRFKMLSESLEEPRPINISRIFRK